MGRLAPRRYPLVGGLFRWRIPIVAAILALAAAWAQEWVAVVAIAMLGSIAWEIDRAPVLELSRNGLAQGFALPGGGLAGAHVVSWRVVDAVETRWLRPNDNTALETIVRAPDGAVRFTTHMGLRAYRRVLRELERRAPQARRLGLTDEMLRRPVPRRRRWPVLTLAQVALVLAGLLALYL